MLPKENRLPAYLIPKVLKKGKRFRSSLFTLIVNSEQSTAGNQPSRFALVVPVKVDKRAVKRNKIKRQLRQVVRTNLAQIKPGQNVVLLARKEVIDKKFLTIKAEAEEVLKRAGLTD